MRLLLDLIKYPICLFLSFLQVRILMEIAKWIGQRLGLDKFVFSLCNKAMNNK